MSLDYKDTLFFPMLKRYGIKKVLWCGDTIAGIIVSAIFGICAFYAPIALSKELATLLISISTGIAAVIIAGLAITVSNIRFLADLFRAGVLPDLLFPFWLCVVFWAIVLVNGLALFLACAFHSFLARILVVSAGFFFGYALYFTVALIGEILRWGLFQAEDVASGSRGD